jgi:hypothetical protein
MRLYPVLIALIFSSIFPVTAFSQQPTTATRDDGRKVLLYPDGTWRLLVDASGTQSTPSTSKPTDAALFVKAAKGPFGVWINQEKWKQDAPADPPDPIKITFSHEKGDAYAMIISERISVPMESLKNLALSNAKEVAPDAHIVFEEKRIVNGKQVMCLQMEGTTQGIAFTYYGYYYGGPEGTLQVLTYTGKNLFAEYKPDLDDFLNGTQIGQ